ncbi:MAG: sulfurtransferase [Tissierellia bacterium]|nr:sulfurtransferase [Tissierellia bacterium]
MNNIINTKDILENLNDYQLVYVGTFPQKFTNDHIVYLDFDKYMYGEVVEGFARHPVATTEQFKLLLEDLTILDKHIVFFDDGGYFRATRTWWTFKYYGIENVSVLNDMENLLNIIDSIDFSQIHPTNRITEFKENDNYYADMDFVKDIMDNDDYLLIDFRSFISYSGLMRINNPEGGHIPNAINLPADHLIMNNLIVSDELIKKVFSSLNLNKKIVAYCGSGMMATLGVLALEQIGVLSKLYVGSMSDWISDFNNPIEFSEII